MPVDITGREILKGDTIQTDEMNWVGKAVLFEEEFTEDPHDSEFRGKLVLVDGSYGFSLCPHWDKCRILNR